MNALMEKVIQQVITAAAKVTMLSTGLTGTPASLGKLFHAKRITNSQKIIEELKRKAKLYIFHSDLYFLSV